MTAITLENPVIEAMYEAASRFRKGKDIRHYLGMSGIGDKCARKIWYGFRGYTPTSLEGRVQMIYSLGDAVEKEVLRWLELAGYEVTDTQRTFEALNGHFRGHCDGVIHGITRQPHILEIKSASASRVKAFQTGTVAKVAPTYYAQVQCYMGYSGLERALFVVMNKNTCELYTERVHFDEHVFRAIEERARTIINSNVEPERAWEQGSRECSMCEYSGHCWSSPYLQTHKTCGTCASCHIENLEARCERHNRLIEKWGKACPDWVFTDSIDRVPF